MRTLFLIFALLPSLAFAQPTGIEVVQIDSPAGNVLHAGEPLYVKLKYKSNQSLRFQLAGYLNGARVANVPSLNPAPAYPSGEGEALAWIAFSDKVAIDGFHILGYDKDWNRVHEIAVPAQMQWSGRPARTWRQPAEWVKDLNARLQALAPPGSTEQPPPEQASREATPLLWSLPILGVIAVILLIVRRIKRKEK